MADGRIRRFRGSKRRMGRIHFSRADQWFAVFLTLLCLAALALGGWVGIVHSD